MRTHRGTSILIFAGLALASTSEAKPTTQSTEAKKQEAAEAKKQEHEIDPKAIDALKRMGAYLQKQQSFSVRTRSQTDYVLDDGEKTAPATSKAA